jgi:hypothetical protein
MSFPETNYCTSLFHRLGAGGNPPPPIGGPLDPGLEFDPSDGGAGLSGKFITF